MFNFSDIRFENFSGGSLFFYVIEVIGVSILVSLFAGWIKLIPLYPKKKYYLLQVLLNTAMLTLFLTIIFTLEIYPGWIVLFIVILVITWLSIRLTNNIVLKSTTPGREKKVEN